MKDTFSNLFKGFNSTAKTFLVMWLIGAAVNCVVLSLSLFTGSVLGGLAWLDLTYMSRNNIPFSILDIVIISVVIFSTVVTFYISSILAVKRYSIDKRYLLLPLASLIIPTLMVWITSYMFLVLIVSTAF